MSRRNCSKLYNVPKRPYELERLDQELKLAGEFGLANKREIWRVGFMLSRIRRAARHLLTLDEEDPIRIFEGGALLDRLHRMGVLSQLNPSLDDVLGLKIQDFFARRLQTQVYLKSLAKSIHQARTFIRQGHISVGSQKVNIPSFIVRVGSQQHVDFFSRSTIGGTCGRIGRCKRRASRKDNEPVEEEED